MTNPAPSRSTWTRTFTPVFTRNRHDGWTKQKQVGFINALAETACVTDACRAVGMSTESAYALRRRYDAIDFRLTWDHALDYAVHRLADVALSRAIHGVAVPHYYKGEVVGENRRYNEPLTMFILRHRTPYTYAKCRDRQDVRSVHPEESSRRSRWRQHRRPARRTKETGAGRHLPRWGIASSLGSRPCGVPSRRVGHGERDNRGSSSRAGSGVRRQYRRVAAARVRNRGSAVIITRMPNVNNSPCRLSQGVLMLLRRHDTRHDLMYSCCSH